MFSPGWYRSGEVRVLVGQYYSVLRSVLRTRPQLRGCLSRCRHCRIFFITHPRNAGRKDLGCPFGCSDAHRRQQSTKRSVEYYRGKYGKILRRYQNAKRKPVEPRWRCHSHGEAEEEASEKRVAQSQGQSRRFDPGMVEHLRIVISRIEQRVISADEILEMLIRVFLRQHSMPVIRRIDYVVSYLNENPP